MYKSFTLCLNYDTLLSNYNTKIPPTRVGGIFHFLFISCTPTRLLFELRNVLVKLSLITFLQLHS